MKGTRFEPKALHLWISPAEPKIKYQNCYLHLLPRDFEPRYLDHDTDEEVNKQFGVNGSPGEMATLPQAKPEGTVWPP